MTINYPTDTQLPGLRKLWKEAFGDEDVFLDAFFETAFSPRRCRCITEKGAVVAALYWFEVNCCGQRFAYLYAVATAASHRGRGLFSALLADTKQVLTEAGFDGILLVPETEGLARMYEKFGFSVCSTNRRITAHAGESPAQLREVGATEFAWLRRQFLPSDGVLQEGADLAFLATQCHFWAGEGWLAVGQIYDGKLVCPEFLGDQRAIPAFLRALDVPCGQFRLPGGENPFAYLLPLHNGCMRPGYFAFALD